MSTANIEIEIKNLRLLLEKVIIRLECLENSVSQLEILIETLLGDVESLRTM